MTGSDSLIEALSASKHLELHREKLADLDPETDPIEAITAAFREEQDLIDAVAIAISDDLPGLAEEAEEVAVELYGRTLKKIEEVDHLLGALRYLAIAVEQWRDLSKRDTRIDFGSDLVEAARDDLRRILVPLPVLELGERRYGE